jgi:hypothetical protein
VRIRAPTGCAGDSPANSTRAGFPLARASQAPCHFSTPPQRPKNLRHHKDLLPPSHHLDTPRWPTSPHPPRRRSSTPPQSHPPCTARQNTPAHRGIWPHPENCGARARGKPHNHACAAPARASLFGLHLARCFRMGIELRTRDARSCRWLKEARQSNGGPEVRSSAKRRRSPLGSLRNCWTPSMSGRSGDPCRSGQPLLPAAARPAQIRLRAVHGHHYYRSRSALSETNRRPVTPTRSRVIASRIRIAPSDCTSGRGHGLHSAANHSARVGPTATSSGRMRPRRSRPVRAGISL